MCGALPEPKGGAVDGPGPHSWKETYAGSDLTAASKTNAFQTNLNDLPIPSHTDPLLCPGASKGASQFHHRYSWPLVVFVGFSRQADPAHVGGEVPRSGVGPVGTGGRTAAALLKVAPVESYTPHAGYRLSRSVWRNRT